MADSRVELDAVDLDRYDFDGLRGDIADLLDIQRAAVSTLKWTVVLPVIGTIVAWAVFRSRMSAIAFYPFIVVLMGLLAVAAVNVGIFFVLRNRIAETNAAADRVVSMTSQIHGDYLRVRSGDASLPMSELASVLTRELVFPALTAGSASAFTAARTTSGPIGWLLGPLMKRPLAMVQARVLDALESEPEPDEKQPETVPDEPLPPIEGSDLVTLALSPDLPPGFHDWYERIHSALTRVVGGVGTVATGSMGVVLAFAFVPLVAWVAFGWFVL